MDKDRVVKSQDHAHGKEDKFGLEREKERKKDILTSSKAKFGP